MTVKAVFFCKSIKHLHSQGDAPIVEFEFGAAFGSYLKGLPGGDDANKDWSKWTPSGDIKMVVTNEAAIEQFELGGVYSLTFDKVA